MSLLILAAIVVIGWVSLYFALRRLLKSEIARRRDELRSYVDELLLQRAQLEKSEIPAYPARPPKPVELATRKPPLQTSDWAEVISPEVLVSITERLTYLFGKKVRVLSARPLPVSAENADHVDLWPHQGRLHIHASHEVVQRGS